MPSYIIYRKALLWSTILTVVACSGGGGGGGPMGTPVDDIQGMYAVVHTLRLNAVNVAECAGVLDITSQSGSIFSGTISISGTGNCQEFASQGALNGTVSSSGALSFTISLSALDDLLAAASCEIVGGSETFTGTATTTGVSATRTNTLRCEVEPGVFLNLEAVYTVSGQMI